MLGLNEKLRNLAKDGRSINVGVIGLGQMGLSLVSHLCGINGFKVCAIADKSLSRSSDLCKVLGTKYNKTDHSNNHPGDLFIYKAKKPGALSDLSVSSIEDILTFDPSQNFTSREKSDVNNAVFQNKLVFTDDFTVLSIIDSINIIIDATGYTQAGAEIMLGALCGGKDVVTLNVETDVTIGPILKKIASEKNLVYTLSAGDEPSALKELYDFADGLGFKIICAGKGKNNPLDTDANPSTLADYAASKGSSARMMTSFVDGTKSMIEMACLSNATGLVPDIRGMHGPQVNIKDIVSAFNLKRDGGLLEKEGVVDFVIGDLAPGVFLVYFTENRFVRDVINYLNLGKGPNYLIYRPYHLTSIETPLSLALAYFDRQPWIVPMEGGLVSEVVTVAKRNLKSGEEIDGIGGYTVYGLIDLYETAKKENLLPIGLSHGCILKKARQKGQPITFDDVEFPENTLLLQLRKIQDELIQRK